tara:strand:- start:244 stop:858 length:615 start_codon:yes stop_codon:yes gene_type:complete
MKDYGNGIILSENFVNSEDSKRLIEWIDNNINKFQQYYFQYNPKRHALRFGKDQVFWDSSPHEIAGIDEIEDLARKYVGAITQALKYIYKRPELYVNSFWLAKQESGAMVKPHHDSHSEMNPQFTHSVICYLNANEVGGDLEFPELGINIKPPANSMVSFVSQGEDLLHEVKEINEDRYTMLFWITDKPEYEVKFHSDVCQLGR